MSDRVLFRFSAVALMLGALAMAISGGFHVRSHSIPGTAEFLVHVAVGKNYLAVNLGMMLGTLAILLGLVGYAKSIDGSRAAAFAFLGKISTIVGGTLQLAQLAVDGFITKTLAVHWYTAIAAEKAIAFRVAEACKIFVFGLYGPSVIVFWGLSFVFFGVAILVTDRTVTGEAYPKWQGWIALVAGLGSMAVGITQSLLVGQNVIVTEYVFGVLVGILTFWIFMMGFQLWWRAQFADN